MLEEQRIAAERGVEKAEMEDALEAGEQQGNRQHRRAENEDDAGGVVGPHENGQPEPAHTRRAHGVNGDDEIQPREDRRKTGNEDPEHRRHNRGIGIQAAVRRIKRPAGVYAAHHHGIESEARARHVNVPAQQVDAREGQVLRADHQRDQKIPQHRGNRRNQEKENHDDAVHGEQFVVGLGGNQVTLRRQQVDADHHGKRAAQEKEQRDGNQVQQGDALVVGGEQPRAYAVLRVQIMLAGQRSCRWRRAHGVLFFSRAAGAGAAAPPACRPAAPCGACRDLMYAMRFRTCSSVTSP